VPTARRVPQPSDAPAGRVWGVIGTAETLGLGMFISHEEEPTMVKIDEKRMAERPEGVTEETWRAKLAYEAVQAEQAAKAGQHATRTDDDAQRAVGAA